MKIPPSLMRWIRSQPLEIQSLLESEGFPYDVKIKLTFRCNAECYYCLHGIRTKNRPISIKNHELSTFEWKSIIQELTDLGTKVITFSGGEPTIRADLPDLVKYAYKRGIRVKMTSNGSFLTQELAEKLARNGLKSINISLDGIDKHHDNVRGKGMFERTMQGVNHLIQAQKAYGRPQIRINHVITSENVRYLHDFMEYINQIEDISAIHLLFIDYKHNSEQLSLNRHDIKTLVNQFNDIKDKVQLDIRESNLLLDLDLMENTFETGDYAPESLLIPCYFPFIHMFILPNGDVNVCCGAERSNDLILGNVAKTPVKELWYGTSYRKLRSFLYSQKFGFCAACDHGILINSTIHQQLTSEKILESQKS